MAKNSDQEVSNPTRETMERRHAPRHVAWVPAYVALASDGVERLCVTHDLSSEGGLLMTHAHLQPGDPVTVELYFSPDESRPMARSAHVVRSRRRDRPNTFWTFEAAVNFDESISEAEPQILEIAEKQREWWKDG